MPPKKPPAASVRLDLLDDRRRQRDELLARLNDAPGSAIYPLTPAERGLLLAAFDELSEALLNFTFPSSPDDFASTGGGCTETLLVDERVQQARRVLGPTYQALARRAAAKRRAKR